MSDEVTMVVHNNDYVRSQSGRRFKQMIHTRCGMGPCLAFLCCFLSIFIALTAFGQTPAPHVIRVVMDDNYPPFVFKDNNGKLQGILVDEWQLWERQTGIEVEIHAMDWGEALQRMKAGEFDVIDTIYKTDERTAYLDFSQPYARLEGPIFFDKSLSGITGLESLKGFPVAVKSGHAAVDLLLQNGVTTLLYYTNYQGIIEAAAQHKVNVFVADKPPALYFLNKLGLANEFKVSKPVYTGEFHRAVRKGNTALLQLVEKGFADIGPDELKQVENKWYGEPIIGGVYLHDAKYLALAAVLLIITLGGWSWMLGREVKRRIAAHDESESRLRDLQHQQERILTAVGEGLHGIDQHGKIIFENPAAAAMLGWETKELLGRSAHRVMHHTQADGSPYPQEACHICATIRDGVVRRVEDELFWRKDGTSFPVTYTCTPIREETGEIIGAVVAFRDITERKQAESSLAALLIRHQTLLQTANEGIHVLDEQGKVVEANAAFGAMLGYTSEEVLQLSVMDWDAKWSKAELLEKISVLMEHPAVFETRHRRKDGAFIDVEISAVSVMLEGRRYLYNAARDITERKRADTALRESEEKFAKAFQASHSGILICEFESGRYLEVNECFGRLYGYSRQEMIGRTSLSLGIFQSLEERERILQPLRMGGSVRDLELLTYSRNGDRKTLLVSAELIEISRKQCIVALVFDITERKRATALADGQKQVLEMIASDAPAKDVLETLLRVIESHSREMLCSILLLDRDGIHLRHGAAPSLPETYCQAIDGLAIGSAVGSCGTAVYRREPVFVEDIATDPLWENYKAVALPHGLRACWSTPIFDARQNVLGAFAVYYRQPGLPGEQHRHLIELATHTATIAIGRQRVKAALEESESQLRQSQKMEAIGQLAGGVAHDFNNILASMMMEVDLVRMEENLPAIVKDGLEQIHADAERAANLTRQLLLFGRRQVMQPRILDLNEQVKSLVKMLQRIIGEDVHLELLLHPSPLLTQADAGMLDQVLMNLVVNARDAMPNGGQLNIKTTRETLTAEEAMLHSEAVPGDFVCLTICDNGGGISPEIMPRIFEPFFTTKAEGKGTGLGLATVYGIVKQHQGWIQLVNHFGQGASFHIFLPACAKPVETAANDAVSRSLRGTETILLVEDQPELLKVVCKILKGHGYQVLTAANGQEALDQWLQNRANVALLLTDMVMPGGMSGQELARQLQAEKPGLKVLFASGYSPDIAGREFKLRPGEKFLQKPFLTDHLLETIRRCLDE